FFQFIFAVERLEAARGCECEPSVRNRDSNLPLLPFPSCGKRTQLWLSLFEARYIRCPTTQTRERQLCLLIPTTLSRQKCVAKDRAVREDGLRAASVR